MSDSVMDSIININSFFVQIIDMIPRDLYKASEEKDEDDEIHNTKYYKHRKLPLSVEERKLASAQNLKEKYAPILSEEVSFLLFQSYFV